MLDALLFGEQSFGLLSKSDTMTKEYPNTEQLAVGASRPVDGMRKHPRLPAAPPSGSRGRGPWSGRGSQRVKPRLVSPFEKRRLF